MNLLTRIKRYREKRTLEKAKRILGHYRLENSKKMAIDEWVKNDNACLYLSRFIKSQYE